MFTLRLVYLQAKNNLNKKMSKEEVNILQILENLKSYFFILLKKWYLILIISIVGAAIGLTISVFQKPTYIAKLSFALEESENKGGGFASLAGSMGIGGLGGESLFNTSNILDFMKMRSLVEKALLTSVEKDKKKLTFAQIYIEENELNLVYKELPRLKNISFKVGDDRTKFSLQKDSVLGDLFLRLTTSGELNVSQPKKESSIIEVVVKSKNEIFSMYFPESMVNVVGDYYIETKTKKAKINVNILQKQVDSVRAELYKSISGVAASNDEVFGLNPAMNVKRLPSATKQVEVQTNSAILAEMVKNLEISKVSLMNQTPLIEIVDRPVLPLEKKKLGKFSGVLIGGILSTLLAIVYVLFKDYILKNKLKSENLGRNE